jgi:hypothetical protein
MFRSSRCHGLPLCARPGPSCAFSGVYLDLVQGGRTHQYRPAQRADLERSMPGALCDHLQPAAGSAGDYSGHVNYRPYDCNSGWLQVDVDHPRSARVVPAGISGEDKAPGRTWIQLCPGGRLGGRCGLLGGRAVLDQLAHVSTLLSESTLHIREEHGDSRRRLRRFRCRAGFVHCDGGSVSSQVSSLVLLAPNSGGG